VSAAMPVEAPFIYMIRFAKNINQDEAASLDYLPSDTVLISIYAEHTSPAKLKMDRNSSKILTVQFSDVTCNTLVDRTLFTPLDTPTALKIIDFIELNKEKNFIVHCKAGISRSAAVCLYINIMHGHILKSNFWRISRPNRYALGQLLTTRLEK